MQQEVILLNYIFYYKDSNTIISYIVCQRDI